MSAVSWKTKVVVYPRIFDGICDQCSAGQDMLCRNGGIVGVKSNWRFAEYATVPSKNMFKISEDISWEMAASIPVSALTVYHTLMQSKARFNEFIVIMEAFGNTGLFAVQFANIVGAKVIAVSMEKWVSMDLIINWVQKKKIVLHANCK